MGGKRLKPNRGERIGECIYLHEVSQKHKGIRRALFQCDNCDNKTKFEADIYLVNNKHVKSCGCLQPQIASQNSKKHGMRHDKLYKRWLTMKSRCYNPNVKQYCDYGGRGVTVCDEWRDDFMAYYNCVTNLPNYGKKGYTLDRKENDGNYEPNNVRWADRRTQVFNSRKQKSNTSGFTGICFHKRSKKWVSRITVNYKRIRLGEFNNIHDAVNARNNYIIQNGLWEYDVQLAEVS